MVTNNRRMGSFVHCVRIQYRIIRVKKAKSVQNERRRVRARAGGRARRGGREKGGDDGIVCAAAGETGMRVRCVMDRASCARAMRGSVRRAWTVGPEGARRECAG
jgi:hypothetical protein